HEKTKKTMTIADKHKSKIMKSQAVANCFQQIFSKILFIHSGNLTDHGLQYIVLQNAIVGVI
ncbi:MAG: hypothetical protein IKZ31_06065, partial [Lentisphaeria bacterium]|nr:hypothetical protein [Lentisphaeria bacterium]